MQSRILLLLFVSILFLQSCTRSVDAPAPNPTTDNPPVVLHEKHRVLTRVYSGDGYYSSTMIRYDSSGRIKSFTGVPGDFLVFYKTDTIHHILEPTTSVNNVFSRSSWIFQYRSDKKCYRVLYKHLDNSDAAKFADSNPFWADESNASAYRADSLAYNSNGQLTEIWQSTRRVCKLTYDSASAVVPSSMKDYQDDDGDGIPEYIKYQTSLSYTSLDQPGRRQLWFFPFISFNIPMAPSAPATPSGMFTLLLQKAVRSYSFSDDQGYFYSSPVFEYKYDSDSSHFSGACNPANLSAWFGYEFTTQ